MGCSHTQESDKEHGVAVCREGFSVVITSYRGVTRFQSDLTGLPLHKLMVFMIEEEAEWENY